MQQSLLAISDSWFNFSSVMEKPSARGPSPNRKAQSCAGTGSESKAKNTSAPARKDNGPHHRPRGESLDELVMHEHLPALAVKIAKALSIKSEYVVTQPVELRILRDMPESEVREFANSHGWRVIRRLGGRQIEFYNDASRHPL
jgi:hypothetical protein